MKKKLKIIGIAIALAVLGFREFKGTLDEIGSLGTNRLDRQDLIQLLDSHTKEHLKVTSDFFDYSIISRWWSEPVRTTIRFISQADSDGNMLNEDQANFAEFGIRMILEMPLKKSIDGILERYVQQRFEMQKEEFIASCKENGIESFRDFLAGFGFRHFEYYLEKKLIFSVSLPTENMYHRKILGR
ncbi:MAG: hypothetical protein RBT35_08060 [Bacteroidales bacterium]|jgi:hypothetical protein|nr:hypothetical protein [Bacteroidales bacterium]